MTLKHRILACGSALVLLGCSQSPALVNQDTLVKSGDLNSSERAVLGAEVYSHEKVTFGKFVMRMKLVSNPGVVSSFFTYDNESWQGGIPWREIDIEAIGKHPDKLQTNLITGTAAKRLHSESIHNVESLNEFQEYTLIWTPDEITWLVNGEMVHQELSNKSQQVIDMRDSPQSYRMNVWVSEAAEWVGRFSPQDLPLYQKIDWMEYYSYDDGEFTKQWRDDFNQFDSQRWGKGDWGFESNLATFSPDNVSIEGGQLVMALTLGE
ncbi:family 16 glycosylhydrolase [Vibrio sp. FNV 38]|nr:family 16 glycosylhydrolase [Vibrio sp. FNV 38]